MKGSAGEGYRPYGGARSVQGKPELDTVARRQSTPLASVGIVARRAGASQRLPGRAWGLGQGRRVYRIGGALAVGVNGQGAAL